MSDKCPKCGLVGERVGNCAAYKIHPPTKDSGPFGAAESIPIHLVDGPDCLRRQNKRLQAIVDKTREYFRARKSEPQVAGLLFRELDRALRPDAYKSFGDDVPHPMLCFEHGGSGACEKHNKSNGFVCPTCEAAKEEPWPPTDTGDPPPPQCAAPQEKQNAD